MLVKNLLLMVLLAGYVDSPEDGWERFEDGSTGQATEFHAVDGLAIPAYVRKPGGAGPFPVVVLLHGGKFSKEATIGLGRSTKSPTEDFIQAGWAVFSIDYRPAEKIGIFPIENDDSVEAVKAVAKLPFIDPKRIGLFGASHGGNISSRLVSRVDVRGAVLCAPAAFDLIEVKKAAQRGEPVVSILHKLIADMEDEHWAKAEDIEKDPARFHYSSAMTEVAQVRCPILIINGRNDDNSPVSTIDAYVSKLRAAGKAVETYLPANGPHGFYFGRPDIPEWQEATRRAVAFFRQCFDHDAPQAPAASKTSSAPATAPDSALPNSTSAAPPRREPTLDQYGSLNWVDPDRTEPPGTVYKTFHSATIDADASYLVYLPPDYDKDETTRYPVLYDLHASGGTPRRDAMEVVRRLDLAIRAGHAAPLIVVFPNGLRGATMYCDPKDGSYPVESVIIKDLIPHVDATYRTVASRNGRALDGFSMGGFGAAHLGFKYPELFGVISIMAPPLLGPELTKPRPVQAWSRLFPAAMGSDLEYFRANDPFTLAVKNADALRDRTIIRIVAHVEDENWLMPRCEQLHQLLSEQTIPHTFHVLSNVKSHNRSRCFDTLGDAGWMFFGSSFAYLQGQR